MEAEFNLYHHVAMFNKYLHHVGHRVAVVTYGKGQNVSVECEDCSTVLDSYDIPEPEELVDEDLFSCERCKEIFDIEDSISLDKMLFCESCEKEIE